MGAGQLKAFPGGKGNFSLFLPFVDSGGSLQVIFWLKPCPAGMQHHKTPQQPLVYHPELWEKGFIAIFGVIQQMLCGDIILPGNDGFVMVPIEALGTVPFILFCFVCEIVGGECLSGEYVPAVPFIAKHLHNGVGCPLDIPQIRFSALACKDFCNLAGGVAIEIQVKNQFYRGGFFGVDHQIPFAVVGIPQQ